FLGCDHQPLRDLSILAGAGISQFTLHGSEEVSDLSPLKELPLKKLALSSDSIKDLESLRGLKLEVLWFHSTQVSDISPLRNMPLKRLELNLCDQIKDLTPLADMRTLGSMVLPAHADVEPLRKLPNLKRLSYSAGEGGPACTAEAFWKTWDGLPWARKLEA